MSATSCTVTRWSPLTSAHRTSCGARVEHGRSDVPHCGVAGGEAVRQGGLNVPPHCGGDEGVGVKHGGLAAPGDSGGHKGPHGGDSGQQGGDVAVGHGGLNSPHGDAVGVKHGGLGAPGGDSGGGQKGPHGGVSHGAGGRQSTRIDAWILATSTCTAICPYEAPNPCTSVPVTPPKVSPTVEVSPAAPSAVKYTGVPSATSPPKRERRCTPMWENREPSQTILVGVGAELDAEGLACGRRRGTDAAAGR